MTAAHCLQEAEKESLFVVLGATNALADGEEFEIKNFETHPKYKPPQAYFDIAIIELDISVNFFKFINIHPICLPKQSEKIDNWKELQATVTGYGSKPSIKSSIIHYASLEIITQKECNKKHYEDLVGEGNEFEARREQVRRLLSELKVTKIII